MPTLIIVLLLLMAAPFMQAQDKEYTVAEKMAFLSDLGLFDSGADATKRYEYILPRMRDACSDTPNDDRVGDMLYVGYKHVKNAGVAADENLLKYTESVYRIVTQVKAPYSRSNLPMKCAELFSLYSVARSEGQSPEQAVKTVAAGVTALVELLQ